MLKYQKNVIMLVIIITVVACVGINFAYIINIVFNDAQLTGVVILFANEVLFD